MCSITLLRELTVFAASVGSPVRAHADLLVDKFSARIGHFTGFFVDV